MLAGGEGRRVGGQDKGLLHYGGRPLVALALERLREQVGPCAISANRHLDAYARFGLPVWPDATDTREGPLAGWCAGLQQCSTPYLVSVPCDAPHFPQDLVARLADALIRADADVATATLDDGTGVPRVQPVFSLMKRSLLPALQQHLRQADRRVWRWVQAQRHVLVPFDDGAAFANLNTPDDFR